MDELKQLVASFIGKTLNKSADEVSSLLFVKEADGVEKINPKALDGLLDWDKQRMKSQDDRVKESYDNGYKKAEATSRSKFEKEIREEFKIDDDKQGLDLVRAVAAKSATSSGNEATEEMVRRSKTYLDMVEQMKQEKANEVKSWQDKYNSREKEIQQKTTDQIVDSKVKELLKSLNANLPEDENVQKEWIDMFLKRVRENRQFDVKDDGKMIVPLVKEGEEYKAMVNEHKHPVMFEELLKNEIGKVFGFKNGERRAGTGNNNDDQNGGNKGYKGPVIKTDEEYQKALTQAADDNERIQITESYLQGKKGK